MAAYNRSLAKEIGFFRNRSLNFVIVIVMRSFDQMSIDDQMIADHSCLASLFLCVWLPSIIHVLWLSSKLCSTFVPDYLLLVHYLTDFVLLFPWFCANWKVSRYSAHWFKWNSYCSEILKRFRKVFVVMKLANDYKFEQILTILTDFKFR